MAGPAQIPDPATYHNENHSFNYGGIHNSGPGPAHNGNIYGNVNHNYANVSSDDEEIRKALFVTDPEIDRQSLMLAKGNRVAGTCEWIIKHEAYKSWLTGDPSVLIVSGGPGKGKTMLADFVISSIEESQVQDDCVAYFFCLNAKSTRNNIVSILRGLIWQVVTPRRDLLPILEQHLGPKERRKAALSSPDILWSILIAIASHPNARRLVCVVDGLDECDKDTILFLAERLRGAERQLALHIVIFSRPEHGLGSFAQITLDENEREISSDLDTYINVQIGKLHQRFSLDQDFKQELHDKLASGAQGTFLWVGFASNELLRQNSRTGMRDCLLSLPSGLPALYERMLHRIPDRLVSRCRVALKWAAVAVRPLSLAEMGEVLRLTEVRQSAQKPEVLDIISECGGMLVNQNDVVILVHQSARDYLCNESHLRAPAQWHIAPSKSNADVLRICVNTLEESVIQREAVPQRIWDANLRSYRSSQLKLDFDEAVFASESPLLPYAIKNLSTHAQAIDNADSSIFAEPFFSHKNHKLRKNWDESLDDNGCGDNDRYWLACEYDILPWLQHLLTYRDKGILERNPVKMTRKGRFSWIDTGTLVKVTIKNSDVAMARLLLDSGAHINGGRGQWALHYAVYQEQWGPNLALIQLLIERGANVTECDEVGKTPLHYAAEYSGVETLTYLLDSGASVNATARDGTTVLMNAVTHGKIENTRCVLQRGALVDAKNASGRTALHLVAESCVAEPRRNDASVELLKILLDHGADCLAVDAIGLKPIDTLTAPIKYFFAPENLLCTAESRTEDEWRRDVLDYFDKRFLEGIRSAVIRQDRTQRETVDSAFEQKLSKLKMRMSSLYRHYRYSARSNRGDRPLPHGAKCCYGHCRTKKIEADESLAIQHNCLDCSGIAYCNHCVGVAYLDHMHHRFETLDGSGDVLETWTIRSGEDVPETLDHLSHESSYTLRGEQSDKSAIGSSTADSDPRVSSAASNPMTTSNSSVSMSSSPIAADETIPLRWNLLVLLGAIVVAVGVLINLACT